jgi:hypothetical protein
MDTLFAFNSKLYKQLTLISMRIRLTINFEGFEIHLTIDGKHV